MEAIAKKILIIEDNEDNLEIFSTILKCGGYEPLRAKNGAEGIELAMREKPHLILMDIQMPIMDGFEAIKILRAEPETKNIPSIALTAHQLKEWKESFADFGFNDYIQKPINLRDFINIIDKHLLYREPNVNA